MSDPSAVEQSPMPSPHIVANASAPPTHQGHVLMENLTTTPRDQLNSDALYAQTLQRQYGGFVQRSQPITSGQDGLAPIQKHRNDDSDNDDYYYDSDKDHSFFDGEEVSLWLIFPS